MISGNTISDLVGGFAFAVQVDGVSANVAVSNNTFQLGQLVSDFGVDNSAAIALFRCHSVATVSDNTINIGPGLVFSGIIFSGAADARYHVSGNTINGMGPFTDGIDVAGATGDSGPTVAAVIEHNSMTGNLQGGIGLFGAVSQSTIQSNTMAGDAVVAIGVGPLFPGDQVDQAISNRFLNNDIATVANSIASIFFDTNTVNNLVRGQCVSVLDLGTGNDVSCPNPHSNVNSAAFATRQQILQRAFQARSAIHSQWNDVNQQ